MFDEITASSLIKIDQACTKLHETPFPVNPAGFTIHSCIHDARQDVGCVLHTHSRAGVGVSAQKGGLLPISQQSTVIIPSLGYHDYEGIALYAEEKPRLQASLGANNYLILRNHGLLTVGKTVADAFLAMYFLECACRIQIDAQAGGEVITAPEASQRANKNVMQSAVATGGVSAGALAWPALLRKLDRENPGYDA
jgi:ribulose-5-phosphate 4-epimerase/fuculose-1-phosphate aldolase